MSNQLIVAQASKLAGIFGIPEQGDLVSVLKATAFRGEVTDAQMTALLIVANQYRLNPWTKEIYAFPDKNNGIVPVVGVDGWARIINENAQFDGMDFNQSGEMLRMNGAKSDAPVWIECTMYRKDRTHPVVVREYLDEVYREPFKGKHGDITGPWQSHPKRFLRHKAMIQCARLAFGYVGIYDDDEAQRIVEAKREVDITPDKQAKSRPLYSQADFDSNLPTWKRLIEAGKQTAESVITKVQSKADLTDEQKAAIYKISAKEGKQGASADNAAAAVVEKLRDMAADLAVPIADICEHIGASSLDGITVAQAEVALKFLNGEG